MRVERELQFNPELELGRPILAAVAPQTG